MALILLSLLFDDLLHFHKHMFFSGQKERLQPTPLAHVLAIVHIKRDDWISHLLGRESSNQLFIFVWAISHLLSIWIGCSRNKRVWFIGMLDEHKCFIDCSRFQKHIPSLHHRFLYSMRGVKLTAFLVFFDCMLLMVLNEGRLFVWSDCFSLFIINKEYLL